MEKKFHITTFGCQMNARDSEKLLGILKNAGFLETDDEENADFVISNTCTVRDNANQRVYGRLGALKSIVKKNPDKKIALCGCMMQENSVIEKLRKSYGFVNLIFGTHNLFKFAELCYRMYEEGEMIIDIWDKTDEIVEDLPVERKYSFKSGVNIMFGCNNFCTYCIVPYVRGRERSRNSIEIIREIEKLAKDGVKEVMLLGQNVNSYGNTFEEPFSFAQLLREIEKIDGLEQKAHFDHNTHEHYHMMCDKCKRIFDVSSDVAPNILEKTENEMHCKVTSYDVILHGICEDCLKEE